MKTMQIIYSSIKQKNMKKLLIVSNLATIGFIAFLFFNSNIGCINNSAAKSNTCTNICADYSGEGITRYDFSLLDTMSKYDKSTVGSQEARNIWFSLDTLKRFIWNIENSACGLSCDNEQTFQTKLGIRIYFARYLDFSQANLKKYPDLQTVDPLFSDQQTLFMIPTFDIDPNSKTVQHVDFDITKPFSSNNCAFQRIENNSGPMAALGPNQASQNTAAQNHGGLCPPVCDGGRAFR
jgi:hypothetical protein